MFEVFLGVTASLYFCWVGVLVFGCCFPLWVPAKCSSCGVPGSHPSVAAMGSLVESRSLRGITTEWRCARRESCEEQQERTRGTLGLHQQPTSQEDGGRLGGGAAGRLRPV